MSFKSPNGKWAADDVRWVLPFLAEKVAYTQLGSGASDTFETATLPPNVYPLVASFGVVAAWTVGGGDTTGLTLDIGDAGNPDELFDAANLVGVSANTWLGAVDTDAVHRGLFNLEATAYQPLLTFTPTGGSTELDHVDAGTGIVLIHYIGLPSVSALYTDVETSVTAA